MFTVKSLHVRNTETLDLYILETSKSLILHCIFMISGLRLGCTSSLRHGFDIRSEAGLMQ